MIGLLGSDPHWAGLLGQEGVSFRTDALGDSRTKVLVVDRVPDADEKAELRRFLESGGAAMVDAETAALVWGTGYARRCVRFVYPRQSAVLFRNVGLVDIEARCGIPSQANAGLTDRNRPALYAGPLEQGWAVLLPFRLSELLARQGSGPRAFPARASRRVLENVALTDRGGIRRLVANGLRFLLDRLGLPYVHLAYSPGSGGSVFGFRVDTDFGPVDDIRKVARIARRSGMNLSWFVNCRAHGDALKELARDELRGHDVQVHCYEHRVFDSREENRSNLARAKEAFTAAGLRPRGAASPYGEWNPEWDRALEDEGFEYSSDFGAGYDDLPSRSLVHGRASRVLQVPCHPVSPGRLRVARAAPDEIVSYLKLVIERQVRRREPALLYGHPSVLSSMETELSAILEHGLRCCGGSMTYTDLAGWWLNRERTRYSVAGSGTALEVEFEKAGEGQVLVVERGDRYVQFEAASGRLDASRQDWLRLPQPATFRREWLAARRPDPLSRLRERLRMLRKRAR